MRFSQNNERTNMMKKFQRMPNITTLWKFTFSGATGQGEAFSSDLPRVHCTYTLSDRLPFIRRSKRSDSWDVGSRSLRNHRIEKSRLTWRMFDFFFVNPPPPTTWILFQLRNNFITVLRSSANQRSLFGRHLSTSISRKTSLPQKVF